MKSTEDVLISSSGLGDVAGVLQRTSGALGRNLAVIEDVLNVRLRMITNGFQVEAGDPQTLGRAREVLQRIMIDAERGRTYAVEEVRRMVGGISPDETLGTTLTGKRIQPKTANQKKYVDKIRTHDLTLAIGPAGTGKTYLAVATALEYLRDGRVKRVILTRPVVEAGERLGYLPGGFQEKVNPYLRPLFDAMYDQLTPEKVLVLTDKQIIEVAPLAYMRGRTFSEAFVILDEAQNTAPPQMLMFLTRMGANAKMVVTGDVTQVDLPHGATSGLVDAARRLRSVEGVAVQNFEHADVVRHTLVTKILKAYDRPEAGRGRGGKRHG